MISNLREKLKRISYSCPSRSESSHKNNENIARGDLGGQIIKSQWGEYVVKRALYPASKSYGNVVLGEVLYLNLDKVSRWAKLDWGGFSVNDLVFMDTETTGLSGGVGTLAFLVGLGYFKEDSFVIEQHIMRDFDEEMTLLRNMAEILPRWSVLVTFNGKSYDCPLLENRMIYHRLKPVRHEAHIDLLHVARRLWSLKLESCCLTSLEQNILGEHRKDDIPGELIPNIYYQYLRDRSPEGLQRVMKHNRRDILAMVSLFSCIVKMYNNPVSYNLDCYELFCMARFLEAEGEIDQAAQCYIKCIEKAEGYHIGDKARMGLSYLYKRQGRWEEAMELWRSIASRQGSMKIFPLIEMAKYFEHRLKDYDSALECSNRALELLRARENSVDSLGQIDELRHRKNRIIKKMERMGRICQ